METESNEEVLKLGLKQQKNLQAEEEDVGLFNLIKKVAVFQRGKFSLTK